MTTALYTISISARMTMDMHSLNNEGGEGNQIQTRMVNIIGADGQLHNVNAISGDMFKHIQAEYLFNLSTEKQLPLSAGAKTFNANRINADPEFFDEYKDANDAQLLDGMIQRCVVSDIEGVLITEGKRSLPRKSVIEFGWVVGVPESVVTDSYFHVKYAPSDRTKSDDQRKDESTSGANLGQAIFHRPASSGVYALVCHIDLARIGFNEITQTYAISVEERLKRAHVLLESVLYTFLNPKGAMRSAQAPHLVDVEGVITTSSSLTPAPTVSPLHPSYQEQIGQTVNALRRIAGSSLTMDMFNSFSEFTDQMTNIITSTAPASYGRA